MVDNSGHPTGVVLAEIVKANIPVKNGVVHLIERPLMVVDTTVKDFLEVSALIRFVLLLIAADHRFYGRFNGCDNNAFR